MTPAGGIVAGGFDRPRLDVPPRLSSLRQKSEEESKLEVEARRQQQQQDQGLLFSASSSLPREGPFIHLFFCSLSLLFELPRGEAHDCLSLPFCCLSALFLVAGQPTARQREREKKKRSPTLQQRPTSLLLPTFFRLIYINYSPYIYTLPPSDNHEISVIGDL